MTEDRIADLNATGCVWFKKPFDGGASTASRSSRSSSNCLVQNAPIQQVSARSAEKTTQHGQAANYRSLRAENQATPEVKPGQELATRTELAAQHMRDLAARRAARRKMEYQGQGQQAQALALTIKLRAQYGKKQEHATTAALRSILKQQRQGQGSSSAPRRRTFGHDDGGGLSSGRSPPNQKLAAVPCGASAVRDGAMTSHRAPSNSGLTPVGGEPAAASAPRRVGAPRAFERLADRQRQQQIQLSTITATDQYDAPLSGTAAGFGGAASSREAGGAPHRAGGRPIFGSLQRRGAGTPPFQTAPAPPDAPLAVVPSEERRDEYLCRNVDFRRFYDNIELLQI